MSPRDRFVRMRGIDGSTRRKEGQTKATLFSTMVEFLLRLRAWWKNSLMCGEFNRGSVSHCVIIIVNH